MGACATKSTPYASTAGADPVQSKPRRLSTQNLQLHDAIVDEQQRSRAQSAGFDALVVPTHCAADQPATLVPSPACCEGTPVSSTSKAQGRSRRFSLALTASLASRISQAQSDRLEHGSIGSCSQDSKGSSGNGLGTSSWTHSSQAGAARDRFSIALRHAERARERAVGRAIAAERAQAVRFRPRTFSNTSELSLQDDDVGDGGWAAAAPNHAIGRTSCASPSDCSDERHDGSVGRGYT